MSLTIALLILLNPGVTQADSGPCATGGAVEDVANNAGLVSDCTALLTALDILDVEGKLNWSESTYIGEWQGVTLAGWPLRVTELQLGYRRLNGEIPAELGSLSELVNLDLRRNQLIGNIPAQLGRLSSLVELNLSENELTGAIPAGLAALPGLQVLHLADNRLAGPIPYRPGGFQALTYMDLSENRLLGNLPSWLGGLSNLRELHLCGNDFTGRIPGELGGLENLRVLCIGENPLDGTIPATLGNLANLESLYLHDSGLTGEIPPELAKLSNLKLLDLSENSLSGPIPPFLGDLSNLETLSLRDSNLTGRIPAELGDLSRLTTLHLGRNQLTGPIPPELGRLGNLVYMRLRYNELSGTIPSELYALRNLELFDLSDNQLTGRVTSEVDGLINLRSLILYNNRLNGPIPRELVNIEHLSSLNLGSNPLGGEIPAWLGGISGLRHINLLDTGITGEIPPEWSNLSNLTTLRLQLNKLSGPIPPWLGTLVDLHQLYLNHNQLTGNIPSELGGLKQLYNLSLDANLLTGNIPEELALLSELDSLTMSGNQLTGGIPPALGLLSKLLSLELSQNQLTGEIPAELGEITNLTVLQLSQNQLTGKIPAELGQLTNLQAVTLEGNDLTGCLPLAWSRLDRLSVDDHGLPFCFGQDDDPTTVGSPSALTVREGGLLEIEAALLLENDTPPRDQSLRIVGVGEAVNGTVRMEGTMITYVHDGSETTTGGFTYTASDGVSTPTAAVTIIVRPVNDPPTASSDTAAVDEGGTLQVQTLELLANDSDAEGKALSVSSVGEAVNGTVRIDGTAVTYVHDGSETTTGAFTYTVSDGVDTATATVTVTVRPVNDPPTASSDTAAVDEGGTLLLVQSVLLLNDSDADGALMVSSVDHAVNGTVRIDGTTITYIHDGSETTTGAFTYTASDGVDTATATVAITVRPVNDPPAAVGDTATVDEGGTLQIQTRELLANDSDAEGEALRISAVGEAVNGTARLTGTTITYVHDGSETTSGAFTYTVSDGVDTATAAVTITVWPVNDPPTAVGESAVVDEGGTLQIRTTELLANDSDTDGEALNISSVGEAVNGTVSIDGTAVTYVHDGSETTSDAFAYTVSDGADTATATVTITVKPVNDPPTAVDDIANVDEGDTLLLEESVLLFNDSDAEGELGISGVGNAINGTVRMDGTTIAYVHDGSETTSGAFAYTASDGVDTATATVTITVRPVNDPPKAVGDTAIVDQGETLVLEQSVLLLNDSDAEGETLSILAVRDAVNGTVRMDGTTVTYVHDGSETTTGAFTYTVSDGVVTATATVTITVKLLNNPPVANRDLAVVDQGGTLQMQTSELLVNDSDADGGALRISAVGEAVNGTVGMDGTTITYVHDGSETTSGGFSYTVSDGVDTATATVTITIRPVNGLPVMPLILLGLGVALVTAVILAVVMVVWRERRVSKGI